ncbi:Proline--tRNA ligase [Poriferisphaera corsica]|uniref:Proline--tRNA ligase n=1 Tax=Poriferisphaera corsica TaxID=2528020 RepID=A0A517YVD2_9BACT|nr:proline--tRNA ligase [Poriferisphaera corsica]QDU34201.1 Proline--tRNA ligase [Poriferisphaera corsica]
MSNQKITPRKQNYAQWYQDVIQSAGLAEHSPVRGCMVIRPEGYAIWEAIQRDLDLRIKRSGHMNAYFPMLIPQSFLAKEAQHVEGFAMECAVVTHSKLENGHDNQLEPGGPLEEPMVIRPTSETIVNHMFSQWVQSYRDLPILMNQWCNVMRWEMRTRLFLRTAEFLWQEGHTVHETRKEAESETLRMLDTYADFCEQMLAIPVIKGRKTNKEKFAGAVHTYSIEALLQDGKALQAGTSHFLGQNFSKGFDIQYLGRDQKLEYAWTTSWGVSTRLIGALIMMHSDDKGLVLPPAVAPQAIAIVPILNKKQDDTDIRTLIDQLLKRLLPEKAIKIASTDRDSIEKYIINENTNQQIVVDWRKYRPGDKRYHWEKRGVPLRIEIGPREVAARSCMVKRRCDNTQASMQIDDLTPDWLRDQLASIQKTMLDKASQFMQSNIRHANSYDELKHILKEHGGLVRCFFEPNDEIEKKIQEETKAAVRNIPFDQNTSIGRCIYTNMETSTEVLFALAY